MAVKRFEVTRSEEISVKRFHFPLIIRCKCPKCKTECELDFEEDQLSYPKVNEREKVSIYCDECDEYFEREIILKMAVELVLKDNE